MTEIEKIKMRLKELAEKEELTMEEHEEIEMLEDTLFFMGLV